MIQSLIQDVTTFVVVGYAGREEGVMNLLIQAAKVFDDKNLFWVQHSSDPKALSPYAAQFLATTRNGGLLVGQDADVFFLELCKHLGIGAPSAISDPFKSARLAIRDVGASKVDHADIKGSIEKAAKLLDFVQSEAVKFDLPSVDRVSEIRNLRLAGKHAEAYHLAQESLSQ